MLTSAPVRDHHGPASQREHRQGDQHRDLATPYLLRVRRTVRKLLVAHGVVLVAAGDGRSGTSRSDKIDPSPHSGTAKVQNPRF
jgi:hypothetical protein